METQPPLFPDLDQPERLRRCLRCGRWLKTPHALRVGLGSTCERKERLPMTPTTILGGSGER